MEQKYWEQFTKTGGICDYLGYKMEVYGHRGKDNRENNGKEIQKDSESVNSPMDRYKNDSL